MKLCNPKTKKEGQICNTKTGRWVYKHTKLGEQLLKFQNNIQPNSLSVILKKIMKKEYDIYSQQFVNQTKTRSEALLYKLRLKSSRKSFLTEVFGKGNAKHIYAFIKLVKLKTQNDPSLQEIKLHRITNRLFDMGVLNSFVYSYNDLILNKNFARVNNEKYSILATEDISGYVTFTKYLQMHHYLPDCIIFQLIYTLHTMDKINLRHMDLHGNNIYIKTLSHAEQKMIKYDILHRKKTYSFYVPTTHKMKIIDLDGGFKGCSNKQHFKEIINNPMSITGKQQKSKDKANILKVVHTLIKIQPNIKAQLVYYGLMPENGIEPQINKYNKNAFSKYGLFVNNLYKQNSKFLHINESIVSNIKNIVDHYISLKMYQDQHRYHSYYSQKSLN